MRARVTWQMQDGFCGDPDQIRVGLLRILRQPLPLVSYVEDSLQKYLTGVLSLGGKPFYALCWTMRAEIELSPDQAPDDVFRSLSRRAERFWPELPYCRVIRGSFRLEPVKD